MKMCFFMVYLFSVVKRNKMSSFFFPYKVSLCGFFGVQHYGFIPDKDVVQSSQFEDSLSTVIGYM